MERTGPVTLVGGRALRLLVGLALVALAACFLARAAVTGRHQLAVPFSLGPAEFSNLETIQVIRAGQSPYDPAVYAAPPFVFTVYTPLFHQLVARLPLPDANPFFWGRLVAAVAMVLAGLLPLLVGGRSGRIVACAAAGVFLSLYPVVERMVFLRNDSLGLLFAAVSVVVVQRARGRTAWLLAALGLGVAAVFTKQSFVAAPVACAIYLLVSDRRAFLRFAVAGVVASIAILASVQLGWGSGFWFSTVKGLGEPFLLSWAWFVTASVLREPLVLAILAACLVAAAREWRGGRAAWTASPYPIYVVASVLQLAASLGKVASSTNYFLEPILALLLWLTHALRDVPRRSATLSALGAGLAAAAALELAIVPRPAYPWADPVQAAARQRQLEDLRADIQALGLAGTRVLGLADHAGLYRESDQVQVSYPDLYYWLWHSGALDIGDMLARIERQEFDVILVPRPWAGAEQRFVRSLWGQRTIEVDGPWQLTRAVRESYRVGASRGDVVYFVPNTSAGP